jgi:hypothetical protein
MEFVEQADVVDVPKGSGLKGLLKTVEGILSEIPRVKELHISATGQVRYTWYMPAGAKEQSLEVQFSDLLPYAIIRNTNLEEVFAPEGTNVCELVTHLFDSVARDKLQPVCFVVHPLSRLRKLLQQQGLIMGRDELCGYPVLEEEELPQDALILCASFGRTVHISDTHKAYKVLIGD